MIHIDDSLFDPIPIGIAHDGTWYVQQKEDVQKRMHTGQLIVEEDSSTIVSVVPGRGFFCGGKRLDIDIVFPVLHGSFGEDGTLQGLLELSGIPYAGADTLGSALGMDKHYMKLVWREEGLPVVPFDIIGKRQHGNSDHSSMLYDSLIDRFGSPLFIKPVSLGSSVAVSKVGTREQFRSALEEVFSVDRKAMVEPALNAREIECSVVGNYTPQAYGPGEVTPSHEFYSYDAKYIDNKGAALSVPADIGEDAKEEIRSLAVKAFIKGGVLGFARVDFFMEKKTGKIYINEINTIPGFTKISMFPRMCEHYGLPYTTLISRIIELGLELAEEKQQLRYKYRG